MSGPTVTQLCLDADALALSLDVLDAGEYDDGEASALDAALTAHFDDVADKFDALHAVRRALAHRHDRWAAEAKRLAKLAARQAAAGKRVDALAFELLLAHEKISGETKAQLRNGGWIKIADTKSLRVASTDMAELPGSLVRETSSRAPDKNAIKSRYRAAVKAAGGNLELVGQPIPGAVLEHAVSRKVKFSG